MPGHKCIVGNETSKQLAELGSKCPFIGNEAVRNISIGVSKKAVWTEQRETTENIGNP
jgi:hypothetical protein